MTVFQFGNTPPRAPLQGSEPNEDGSSPSCDLRAIIRSDDGSRERLGTLLPVGQIADQRILCFRRALVRSQPSFQQCICPPQSGHPQ